MVSDRNSSSLLFHLDYSKTRNLHKSELRFQRQVPALVDVGINEVNIFSNMHGKRCTFSDIERHLKPAGAKYLLNNQAEMPDKPTSVGHQIYATAEKIVIYAEKPGERVPLSDPCSLEKALVIALAQPLILLQKLLLPKDTAPRGFMNGKLKTLLVKLGQ